jgi:hypothetical protein
LFVCLFVCLLACSHCYDVLTERQIRTDLTTDKVHAAFAFPGASVGQADAAAVGVFRFLLGGSGSSLKGSFGGHSSPCAELL